MLYLSRKQADDLVEHSKKESPNEACGILAGLSADEAGLSADEAGLSADEAGKYGKVDPSTSLRVDGECSRTVEKIYPMTNTDKSPETFFMDPEEQFKVMKEIRNLGYELVGIYHSHIHTEAYPSAHDVELAYYPEVSYVIVSIKDKDNPCIRSFKIVEGEITEEEVKIE